MNPKIKDAVTASFVADALSLGVHWVYDTADIDRQYGRLETMTDPILVPYHKDRKKGDFTHYGDQMMVLLESVVADHGFDLNRFFRKWNELFKSYPGYMDHATKETLAAAKEGKSPEKAGSGSLDLAGAARIPPLALGFEDDESGLIRAARAQTAMTHNHPLVVEASELFARVFSRVLAGTPPVRALELSGNELNGDTGLWKMIQKGIDSRTRDTREAIAGFGQMCSVQAALPSTVHLIVKYEDDLKEAMVENIMAGGDSAARGMLTGFILGGFQGLEKMPDTWLADMAARDKISSLINL